MEPTCEYKYDCLFIKLNEYLAEKMNGLAIHLLFCLYVGKVNAYNPKNPPILMMNEQRKAGMLYAKFNRA